ncbi:two-component response regulator TrxR [Bacillus sp. JCM 19046]|nr:two-component response regulator TrxR [Bacillus sp. JCM 19046]
MYKVLIVDDESAVREGLRAIIPWEEYGFEVTELAKDGQEALHLCHNQSFDLLLSDIRMGQMDGLQLIKAIRTFDNRLHCLILTGYADFDYAKQAIQYQVAGYLLKPLEEENLIPFLKEIKKKLDKEHALEQLTKLEQQRKQEAFIISFIDHEGEQGVVSHEQFDHLLKLYRLDWPAYAVILIQVESNGGGYTNQIKQQLMECFKGEEGVVFFTHHMYAGVVINTDTYRNYDIQRLYKQVEQSLALDQIIVSASLGKTVTRLISIKESYQHAVELLEQSFFYPKQQLVRAGSEVLIPGAGERADLTIYDVADQLYLALELDELSTIETVLTQLHAQKKPFYSEREFKKTVVCVLTVLVSKLQKAKPEMHDFLVDVTTNLVSIYSINHYEDVVTFVQLQLKSIGEQLEHEEGADPLKKLLMLIDTNYHENLKLEKLADLFHYNSAYLGKLFKSYTGEYFNTYVDKVRINQAKKLLLQGDKVYRVAETVGYNNVDYFHSKFKKYVGLSPSAYRRKEKNIV